MISVWRPGNSCKIVGKLHSCLRAYLREMYSIAYMNKIKFLLITAALLITGACARSGGPAGIGGSEPSYNTMASEPMLQKGVTRDESAANITRNTPAPQDPGSEVSIDKADRSQQAPVERKIIRNAELTVETSSPEEAQQKIAAIAAAKNGFVVESQQSTTNSQATTRDRVTMTLRVPADKFDEALDEIRKAGGRVLVETVKGQDVTEEFIDVEARLKTKKELEEQFLGILKQAKNVQDTLEVQTELSRVRGEIEQIEGKKRFLENQTSLSTVKLTLQTPTVFSANSSGFVYQLGQSLNTGVESALSFVLGFIVFIIAIIPFLVLVVLPVYLLLRYFWRKYKKRRRADKLADKLPEEQSS